MPSNAIAYSSTVFVPSFCIDPRGVSEFTSPADAVSREYATFGPAALPMWRLSLLQFWPQLWQPPQGPSLTANETRLAAEEWFVANDDLTVDLPTGNAQSATQTFLSTAGGPAKRVAEGRFSWLATLTPASAYGDEYYNLSIVVLRERQNLRPAPTPTVPTPTLTGNLQFSVPIPFPANTVSTDGNVTIQLAPSAAADTLQAGSWVMLCGERFTPPAGGYGLIERTYQWYRVSNATSTPSQVLVSLVGPAWDKSLTNQHAFWLPNIHGRLPEDDSIKIATSTSGESSGQTTART